MKITHESSISKFVGLDITIQGDTLFVSAKTKIELLYAKWSELFTEDDWKRSVNGTPFYLLIFVKLKARLVAKGFSQRSGIDFDVDGTAVGGVSPIATRLLLVMCFCLRFVIGTCDTCQAFLISSLESGCNIYMETPPFFADYNAGVKVTPDIVLV